MSQELPHSPEAEEAVVSLALVEPEAFDRAAERIRSEDFHDVRLGEIWACMAALASEGHAISMETVASRLRDEDKLLRCGGVARLLELSELAGSASQINYYVGQIRHYADLRMGHRATLRAVKAFLDPTSKFDEVMGQLEQDCTRTDAAKGARSVGDIMPDVVAALEQDKAKTHVPFGFSKLDTACGGGASPGDLIIVAGRTSMGKSAFAMQVAFAAGVPAMIFSLEMTEQELVQRELARRARVYSHQLAEKGNMRAVALAATEIGQLPVYIDDQPGQSIAQIGFKLQRAVRRWGVRLAVIDYLGLMRMPKADRKDIAIGEITARLKELGKKCGVPIILLHQINRSVEGRENKRPRMSDLKDSGHIEEDADKVILLYRPNYYEDPASRSMPGPIEIDLAKNRGGACVMQECRWEPAYLNISEYDDRFSQTMRAVEAKDGEF